MTEEIKQKFNEWLEENGGQAGVLYQTFSDEELENIFMSSYVKNNKRRRIERVSRKNRVEQYRDLYLYEANKVRRLIKSNVKYSGKHYVNSPEKLNAIKQKYKNGVTQEIIEEWLGK